MTSIKSNRAINEHLALGGLSLAMGAGLGAFTGPMFRGKNKGPLTGRERLHGAIEGVAVDLALETMFEPGFRHAILKPFRRG